MAAGSLVLEMGPGGTGSVHLDGERVRGVLSVTVECKAGQVPTAVVRLRLSDVEVSGRARVVLSEEQQETMRQLGWHPPIDALEKLPERTPDQA